MKKFFLYPLILCLSICLISCGPESADGETSDLEDSQNSVMTDELQDSSEPSGQEPGAEVEPGAEEEPSASAAEPSSSTAELSASSEPSSSAGEEEESEFDALPRWTFDEIANAKVGDIVTFGNYEQDGDAENGAEPIEWFILDMEDGQATLLSVYLLDGHRYHPEEMDKITWEDCELRAWLNDDFLNAAFTEAEQEHIAVTNVINEDNPIFGTPGGNDTADKIWLFSFSDLEKYFHISVEEGTEIRNKYDNRTEGTLAYTQYCYDQDHRILAKPTTAYAIQPECDPLDIDAEVAKFSNATGPYPGYYASTIAEFEAERYADGCARWRLRSPGKYESYAAIIGQDGSVSCAGSFLAWTLGVRPALTVTY